MYSTTLVIRHVWDQGTAGLQKRTDYWEKSELLSCTAQNRSFRIDCHLTEFIIIYVFCTHKFVL
jgi:hypothetical protein